jgi:hypothetical protein
MADALSNLRRALEVGSEILLQQAVFMPRDAALRVPSLRTVLISSG